MSDDLEEFIQAQKVKLAQARKSHGIKSPEIHVSFILDPLDAIFFSFSFCNGSFLLNKIVFSLLGIFFTFLFVILFSHRSSYRSKICKKEIFKHTKVLTLRGVFTGFQATNKFWTPTPDCRILWL